MVDLEALKFAHAVVKDVVDASGTDEWATECIHENLHYLPHEDGAEGHLASLNNMIVAPPEQVVLTAEEREAIASAIYDVMEDNIKTRTCDTWREVNRKQVGAVLAWLAANGFALVRTTKAVSDGA